MNYLGNSIVGDDKYKKFKKIKNIDPTLKEKLINLIDNFFMQKFWVHSS